MSDQDFFFDEEEEVAKEATKTSSKPAGKAAPAPRKSAPKTTSDPAPKASGGIFEQQVSMTVAALMTVIGVLLGVIIGFVIAPDGGGVATTPTTGTGATSTAPQLSEEQLNSGELPAGHPSIDSMGGSTEPTETPAE